MRPFSPAGEPAPHHEKGRDPDAQQEDVQQIQKEQAWRRRLRRVHQKPARQELPVQRRLSGQSHVHGSPAALQPRRTHAAHAHAPTPVLQPCAPLQHGDGDGLRGRGGG